MYTPYTLLVKTYKFQSNQTEAEQQKTLGLDPYKTLTVKKFIQ